MDKEFETQVIVNFFWDMFKAKLQYVKLQLTTI